MKLVKFKNGKYGIRKTYWLFWYKYYDFASSGEYWWAKSDRYFNDCQTDEIHACDIFNSFQETVLR